MIELIIIVAAVIVVSALCSVMEAILYAVPLSHIEAKVEQGNKSARILQKLRQRIDQPITAILTLNTFANTAGAALAGAVAARVLGNAWMGLFLGLLTLGILLLSEIIPKTIGVVYSRQLSAVIARPLLVLVWVLRPFVWLASLMTAVIARGSEHEKISQEELIVMARLSLRKGEIESSEMQVIQNILSLEDRTVQGVMTPRTVVFVLGAKKTVKEAQSREEILTHSRIPVFFDNSEDIEGIVHRRDILNAVAKDEIELKLEELMKPVHFVLEKDRLDKVLQLFLDRSEHLFIVIDEFGGLAGVITLEDVLEEILGREIVDEFDEVTDMRELAQRRRQEVIRNAQNLPPIRRDRRK